MSTKIKIGADELILWLRKNDKAKEVPNDGKHGLGMKILNLIENNLGGKKVLENHPAHWANLMDDKNVEKFNLPKTSAQYEIETVKLGALFENLNTW